MDVSRRVKTMRKEGSYPDSPSLPSGEMSVLRTQDVWPEKEATAPPGAVRTSCRTRRLSSDALRRSWEVGWCYCGLVASN